MQRKKSMAHTHTQKLTETLPEEDLLYENFKSAVWRNKENYV